jgi:hypothetical protein
VRTASGTEAGLSGVAVQLNALTVAARASEIHARRAMAGVCVDVVRIMRLYSSRADYGGP